MKNEITIKRLNENDTKLFIKTAEFFYKNKLTEKYARDFLKNKDHYFLVAELDEKIVGFVFAYKLAGWHKQESELFLYDTEVLKSYRRKGIATKLFNKLKEIGKYENLKIWLVTEKSNRPACSFYASLGGKAKNNDDVIYCFNII